VQREDRLQSFLSVLAGLEVAPFDSEEAILAGRIYGDPPRQEPPRLYLLEPEWPDESV
jgi:hypothetical protein